MAITSDNVNKATVTVDKNDPYPGITARPLNQPDFVNIRPKNPSLSFRWVNRSVGPQESTLRLDQMSYAGFVPALPEDCANLLPALVKNGKIVHGDLMLMKIDKKILLSAEKYNWQRAVNRLHPKAQLQNGQAALRQSVSEVPQRVPDLNRKLGVFRPNEAELAKLESQEDGTPLDLGVKSKE
jgi:hypothetical protein